MKQFFSDWFKHLVRLQSCEKAILCENHRERVTQFRTSPSEEEER